MGCDCETYLVKSDAVNNFDYEHWFTKEPVFPEVNGVDAQQQAPYLGDGRVLWRLFDYCKLDKLRQEQEDGWCVVEINLDNIDTLCAACKELAMLFIDIDTEEAFNATDLRDRIGYFLSDWGKRFYDMYGLLMHAKRTLQEHTGYSCVALIYF